MINFDLNTTEKNIVGGINEVDSIYEPVIAHGDSILWDSQTEGTVDGALTQVQYDAIKMRIENGLPIIIKVDYAAGFTATFTSITSSSSSTPGKYSFMYIGYTNTQFYLKIFRMESDLTCEVYTKII